MKLTKENIYVPLEGYSEEELTELYNFLESINEPCEGFLNLLIKRNKTLEFWDGTWFTDQSAENKTPVTIEQLKEILQPMETFTPVAMKCTQEHFEAVKPKLRGLKIKNISSFSDCTYLVNNLEEEEKLISNVLPDSKGNYNREVHEEWNEEIFLKACGIEVETHEEQLEKAEEILTLENVKVDCRGLTGKEIVKISDIIYNKKGTRPMLTANGYIVHGHQPMRTIISYEKFIELFDNKEETLQEKEQRLLKELEVVRKKIEDSKIKVGDWVVVKETKEIFKVDEVDIEYLYSHHEKITNPQLIELLENEVK